MNLITLKFELDQYEKVKEYYSSSLISETGDYLDFASEVDGVKVRGYISKKSRRSVVFSGEDADIEAMKWESIAIASAKESKPKEELHIVDFGEQIGSDEVGVGDFYLPWSCRTCSR